MMCKDLLQMILCSETARPPSFVYCIYIYKAKKEGYTVLRVRPHKLGTVAQYSTEKYIT